MYPVKTDVDIRTRAEIDRVRRLEQPPRTRAEWVRSAIREKLERYHREHGEAPAS